MSDELRTAMGPAIAAARRYCALLERVSEMDRFDFLEGVEEALIALL